MKTGKQPDEQAMLFFCGMANAQAAQGLLAWRWSREAFGTKAWQVVQKPVQASKESRQECCGMAECVPAAK